LHERGATIKAYKPHLNLQRDFDQAKSLSTTHGFKRRSTSNPNLDKSTNATMSSNKDQTSTLQGYVDQATGAVQSALGSLTGSTSDQVR
jgi:hypothetical protein